jgi:hypothetical protein
MKTRESQIRDSLHSKLKKEYNNDPDTIILDEFNVCQGEARIDIALINGAMHGFEIKSDHDTLKRLLKQIDVYNRIFDTVTIVTGTTHYNDVIDLVPSWWGVKLAQITDSGETDIKDIRDPQINNCIDPFSLAQFLWRSELLKLLEIYGIDHEVKKMPKFKIWAFVAENIPLLDLKSYVRDCFKKRQFE